VDLAQGAGKPGDRPERYNGPVQFPFRAPRPLTYFEVKVGYFHLPPIRTATEDNGWRFRKE